MKFHNPFTVLNETNSFILVLCVAFLFLVCTLGFIAIAKFSPILSVTVLTIIALARVLYAVFKGK